MASIGSTLTFSVVFTDAEGGVANPDLVEFWLREEIDGTELQWTINGATGTAITTPTGMNALVRDSTGLFHLSFVARKPERQSGYWRGSGTIFQASEDTAFVRHSAIGAIDSP